MSNGVLTILFGVKKSADAARKKKGSLGFLGSRGPSKDSYDDAEKALEQNDHPEEEKE